LDAQKAEPRHHRLVGDAQHERVLGGLVAVRPPCRRGDDVAAAPLEAFAVDRGRAAAFDDGVDVVRGCLQRRGLGARISRIMCKPMVAIAGSPSCTLVPNGPDGSGLAASSRLSVSLNGNTNGESLVGTESAGA